MPFRIWPRSLSCFALGLEITIDRTTIVNYRGGAEELVGLVEMEVNAVHSCALKEVAFPGECLDRCIPGGRNHVLLAVQQSTRPVAHRRVDTVAAIVGNQLVFAHAFAEHLVNIFFYRPRLAHPPAGYLPDNRIHPQPFLHLGNGVIALLNHRFLHGVAECGQYFSGGLVQRMVQKALGETEGLSDVNQQNVNLDFSEVVLKTRHCPSILHAGKWQ